MIRPTFDTFDEEWARRIVGARSSRGIDGYLGIVVTTIEPGGWSPRWRSPRTSSRSWARCTEAASRRCATTSLGVVMYPVMPPGSWAATTEFKINLLAPVTTGVCRATSEIIAMTKRMAVVRIEIENEGRLVAAAQGTCTIVAPKG